MQGGREGEREGGGRSEERGRKEKDNYDNDIPCTCPLLLCIYTGMV